MQNSTTLLLTESILCDSWIPVKAPLGVLVFVRLQFFISNFQLHHFNGTDGENDVDS